MAYLLSYLMFDGVLYWFSPDLGFFAGLWYAVWTRASFWFTGDSERMLVPYCFFFVLIIYFFASLFFCSRVLSIALSKAFFT